MNTVAHPRNRPRGTASGLTEEEARQRLHRYGPNRLAEEEKISRLKIFGHQFASPLIYILLPAAVVTLLLREYVDAGGKVEYILDKGR